MKQPTKDVIHFVILGVILFAVVVTGFSIRYAINTARFPDSPWWSKLMK